MTSRKQVFRVTLNSADKASGTNQNAEYYVKLPYVIKRGQMIVEKLTITNAGTLFNGVTSVKIVSPSFPDPYTYNTSNEYHKIGELVLDNNHTAGDEFFYHNTVNIDDVGYGLINYNFDNQFINIQLKDQTDTALTNAQITNYQLTLVIVDHEADSDLL